jgi:hypothetical protein
MVSRASAYHSGSRRVEQGNDTERPFAPVRTFFLLPEDPSGATLRRRMDESERPSEPVEIAGKQLFCPICGHDKFWPRKTLLNTRAATFFNFDWANKRAENEICAKCGYIFWFLRE